MKRAALSAPSLVIAPAMCIGLLAMTPSGRPSIRASAVTISGAKRSRRKVTEPASASVSIASARRRRRGARRSGTTSRSARLVGRRASRRAGPGSRRAAAWSAATASASSATATSTTPFGACTVDRPDRRRARTSPSPPPSIIAGPPMPSEMSSVATIRSEQPASTALPAKQRPGDDRDPRHEAREPRPEREGAGVERRDDRVVGVAGPPAAALGEEDRRQPHPLDQLEQAVLLAVADRALGAGEHRVVVGEHGAGGALAEQLAVDPGGAADQAVGGRARDQLVDLAPRPLGGDREAAVLDEAARVDEVGEVLARGAPAARRGGARPPRAAPRRSARRRSSSSARSSRTPSSRTGEDSHTLERVGLTVTNATLDGVAVGMRCDGGEIVALGPGVESQPGDEVVDAGGDGARPRPDQRPHARGDDPVSRLRRRPAADGVADRAHLAGREADGR